MCSRSPECLRICGVATAIAGAESPKLFEGIDPGAMPITPLHSKAICSNQRQREGADVQRNSSRVEQGTAAHLFNTGGTGAGEPQRAGRIKALVRVLVPLDKDSGVQTIDGVWNGMHGGKAMSYGFWAMSNGVGYWSLELWIRLGSIRETLHNGEGFLSIDDGGDQ
jgi:hypothetical protein